MIEFIADKNRKLSKLALVKCEDLSFSALQKLLRNKDVKVNGKRVGQDVLLEVGDKVTLFYNPKETEKFSELFVDNNVLVIYKKKGYTSESVFESVTKKYPNSFFIHRLDRNTDGIMIFALNEKASEELLFGFKNHDFIKKYSALVYGVMPKQKDLLTAYLLKDSESSTVKIFDKKVSGSVEIKTGYEVVSKMQDCSLLKVTLYTGKTHQIRAHLAHIGHFIIGDGKYGDKAINEQKGAKKQHLTACLLTLKFQPKSPLYYLNDRTFEIGGAI